MSEALLVICPEDSECPPPSIEHLAAFLATIGLTGDVIRQDVYTRKHQYMTGERFLDLIAFLGCSPNIKLEPDKDHQSFCHINIFVNQGESLAFKHGRQTAPPRCPACRKPLGDWRALIENDMLPEDRMWTCPACGKVARPWQYDWRKTAGFGRCLIEITDIFPKEALPQTTLLDALAQQFSMNWTWFYQF
jgi:hypothetical protein